MPTLNSTIANITQRTYDSGPSPSGRAIFSANVAADITNIITQLNQVHKVINQTLISESGLDALDKGMSGNVIKTHVDATASSATAYWSPVKGRANTIKETVDVILGELSRLENLISTLEDISEFDASAILSAIAENSLDLVQLASDTMGPNYVLNGDGVPVLTYSISQAVDAIGALFTGYVASGNTYAASFPALGLTVNLSQVNLDTTIPQSTVTDLSVDLTAIRSFTGMTNASDSAPTYSSWGPINYISDSASLERAIWVLDNTLAGVAASIPSLSMVLGVNHMTSGEDIGITNLDGLVFGNARVEHTNNGVNVSGTSQWVFATDFNSYWGDQAFVLYDSGLNKFILETEGLSDVGTAGSTTSTRIYTGQRTVTDASGTTAYSGDIDLRTGDVLSTTASAGPQSGNLTLLTGNTSTLGFGWGGYSGNATFGTGDAAHSGSGNTYIQTGTVSGSFQYSGAANFRSGSSWNGSSGSLYIESGYAGNGTSGSMYINTGYGTSGSGGIYTSSGVFETTVKESATAWGVKASSNTSGYSRKIMNIDSSGVNRLLKIGDDTFVTNEQINEIDFGRYTQQSNEGRGFVNPNRMVLREDWKLTPRLVSSWGSPWANRHWSIYGTNADNNNAVQTPGSMALSVSGSKMANDTVVFAPSTRDATIVTGAIEGTTISLFLPTIPSYGYSDVDASLNPWIPDSGTISILKSTTQPTFRTSIRTSNSLANLRIELGIRRMINVFDDASDDNKMFVRSINGGNFFLVTSSNTSDTVTDLGIAPSTNTWYTIEMITDSSRYVHCFINKVQRNSSTSNRLHSAASYLGVPYVGAKLSAGAGTTRYFLIGPVEVSGELPSGTFS